MEFYTKDELATLLENGRKRHTEDHDPMPVIKLFTPTAGATWLISEIDQDDLIAFGLCDLGLGCPELGYVSLEELKAYRGPLGLGVEKDLHFKPAMTLSAYASKARIESRISA